MTAAEWKTFMGDLLDGLQVQLTPRARAKTTFRIAQFRSLLNEQRTVRARKAFEQEVEAFVQSNPSLRTAANRHIAKIGPPIIEKAAVTMKKAMTVLIKLLPDKQKTKRASPARLRRTLRIARSN